MTSVSCANRKNLRLSAVPSHFKIMQKTFTFNLYSVVFFFFVLMMPGHCRDCGVVCLCLSVWIQPEQRILSVCLSGCYVPPYYTPFLSF